MRAARVSAYNRILPINALASNASKAARAAMVAPHSQLDLLGYLGDTQRSSDSTSPITLTFHMKLVLNAASAA
jgi:hypothetical protein